MTNAILWEWAKDQGLTPANIAEALGYQSTDYIEQVLRGWAPITDKFIDHCLDNPGDKALEAFEKIAN